MIRWFNLLAFIPGGIPSCLECDHPLGSDGDGLVYCAYCLEKEEVLEK